MSCLLPYMSAPLLSQRALHGLISPLAGSERVALWLAHVRTLVARHRLSSYSAPRRHTELTQADSRDSTKAELGRAMQMLATILERATEAERRAAGLTAATADHTTPIEPVAPPSPEAASRTAKRPNVFGQLAVRFAV